MSDEDLNLVDVGETPPPDKPDPKTQEELDKLEIGRQADDLNTRRTLRKPALGCLVLAAILMFVIVFLVGFHVGGFSIAPTALTALIAGLFVTMGVAARYLFK